MEEDEDDEGFLLLLLLLLRGCWWCMGNCAGGIACRGRMGATRAG